MSTKRRRQSLAVVGLGYVGLSTAVCLASRGVKIIGIEVDSEKLKLLRRGKAPFEEKGVTKLLKGSLKEGRLSFTDSYVEGVEKSDTLMVTVGTPSKEDGSADLYQVKSAAESLAKELGKRKKYKLVAVKSTVPAGTTAGVVRETLEKFSGKRLGEFGLASNPEFLREGSVVEDTLRPNRIVIGGVDARSATTLEGFYRSIYGRSWPPILKTNSTNAELIKYASNAFLATKITFINEVANLCSKLPGADVSVVAKGMGLDDRIGPAFLKAGLGYGGSCFKKDVNAMLKTAERVGVTMGVAAAAEVGNEMQALVAVELAEKVTGGLGGKKVALLGLAFKPDSDDMRDAVSLRLIPELEKRKARIVAYDPVAMANARRIFGGRIGYARSARKCIEGADCCILVTEWEEFGRLEPKDFSMMKRPFLIDGRRTFDPAKFRGRMEFEAIGLGPSLPG